MKDRLKSSWYQTTVPTQLNSSASPAPSMAPFQSELAFQKTSNDPLAWGNLPDLEVSNSLPVLYDLFIDQSADLGIPFHPGPDAAITARAINPSANTETMHVAYQQAWSRETCEINHPIEDDHSPSSLSPNTSSSPIEFTDNSGILLPFDASRAERIEERDEELFFRSGT